uniref:Moesin/ezrin/radixin homolog 1 n=1 Tax=Panagrolaimus sp. JU765 TaxID=591449 RepID=A0AC34QJY2_9BILA
MIRFGTGTYNVRDTEGVRPELPPACTSKTPINPKPSTSMLKCKVFFLDDSEQEFYFHKNALGEELLEKIYAHVELVEKDFFGLQFVSILDVNSSGSRMKWLDAKKSIKRQMVCPPYHLFFRVKFYVNDPSKLIEEYTRYQFYLQLRKDLIEGRLPCTDEEAAILGSYAAQSEIGDFSPEEHAENYLDSLRIIPNQKPEVLQRIAHLHQLHVGLVPSEAEFKFLDIAKHLNLYGFDLYEAKDGNDSDICIGVNSNGISIFQSGLKLNSFPWAAIIKISFKRKQFYIQMKTLDEKRDQVDTVLVFNAISSRNCKLLWKSCIECHTFFRLIAPPAIPQKSLFHLGSRFRYSGRTEYQTVEEMRRKARVERNFNRHCSMTAGSRYRNEVGIDGPQSSSMSTASNSSAFSATSAADFASKFSSRCRRLIPSGGRAASFLRENIIRKKMAQFTEMNPTAALPSFFQQFIPRSSSTFKLNQELTRPDDAEFADDEW